MKPQAYHALFLLLTASVSAMAQSFPSNGRLILDFKGSSVASPDNPVVTLRAWAAWDPTPMGNVFLTVRLDLGVSEPGLENPVPIVGPPFSSWGTPTPLGYTGAAFGQVHLPGAGIFGNPDNPILLGTIDWRATDFTARTVDLWTENESEFWVDFFQHGWLLEPVTSGQAVITVMPCYADCDGSTTLDIFDFLCFQDAFVTGCP